MKPRKHGLLFREGVEIVLALALVVLPTWIDAAGSPMPVMIAVSLVHVVQVAAGVDRTVSRHLLLGTALFLDVAGIVSEIYDNYANFTEAGLEPDRTTRALYVLLVPPTWNNDYLVITRLAGAEVDRLLGAGT